MDLAGSSLRWLQWAGGGVGILKGGGEVGLLGGTAGC